MNRRGILIYQNWWLRHFSPLLPDIIIQIPNRIDLLTILLLFDLVIPESTEDEDRILDGLLGKLFLYLDGFEDIV